MRFVPLILALVLALPATAAASETPRLVAPGETERFAPVATPCPSFSWTHTAGVEGFELIVSRVHEEGEVEEVALTRHLPPGATFWTPSADACLAPGAYAWMIRALRPDRSRWSEASFFRVRAVPDRHELERALAIVRRYLEARSGPGEEAGRAIAEAAPGSEPPRQIAPQRLIPMNLATAAAAIRGELGATTGVVHGVVGISNSTEGAGVAAENSAGGADLVLGGTVPARITENRWELDSGSASNPTFDFSNPSGALSLRVNGAEVLTGTVETADLANSAVTSAKIGDGEIVDADVSSSAAISGLKTTIRPSSTAHAVVSSDCGTFVQPTFCPESDLLALPDCDAISPGEWCEFDTATCSNLSSMLDNCPNGADVYFLLQ